MRVVYKFGDFRMWGEIPDEKCGTNVYLIHPLGSVSLMPDTGDVAMPSIKKMEFAYRKRLDRDLMEYEYVGEA